MNDDIVRIAGIIERNAATLSLMERGVWEIALQFARQNEMTKVMWEESLAMQRLNCAAPELHKSLRDLIRVVDGTLQGYGILEAPLSAARAALRKAEGATNA